MVVTQIYAHILDSIESRYAMPLNLNLAAWFKVTASISHNLIFHVLRFYGIGGVYEPHRQAVGLNKHLTSDRTVCQINKVGSSKTVNE